MKTFRPAAIALFSLLWLNFALFAQEAQFGGFRFGTDLNYFHQARAVGLVQGKFSSFVVGGFYRHYATNSGMEVGLNLNYKGSENGFRVPVVMNDFRDGQNTSFLAVEGFFHAGPHLGFVNPRIGGIIGYRFNSIGFLADSADNRKINPFYFDLPFGCSIDFPTGYGEVGIGAFFRVGVMNVIHNDGSVVGGVYEGGRSRAITLEISTTFGKKGQKYYRRR